MGWGAAGPGGGHDPQLCETPAVSAWLGKVPDDVTSRPGYRLEVAEDELDLRVFTRLCRDGGAAVRAENWAAAFGGLGQALGLWRGAPFADAGCERLQREQAPPLSELRLQAAQWRAEAGLALGRHAELASELAGWCAAEPLRERFAALRMLALYRSGRQADRVSPATRDEDVEIWFRHLRRGRV